MHFRKTSADVKLPLTKWASILHREIMLLDVAYVTKRRIKELRWDKNWPNFFSVCSRLLKKRKKMATHWM